MVDINMSSGEPAKELRAVCVHCPFEQPFHVAKLPMPLGEVAELLRLLTCPNCGAGSESLRIKPSG